MHRAFQLTFDDQPDQALITKGKKIFETDLDSLTEELRGYVETGGTIDAEMIKGNWFKDVTPDVFISHSHQDRDKAFQLAGWLMTHFNLRAFVDSSVWGDSRKLQQIIDDKHSWLNREEGTYGYEWVCRAAAHVHMMLATSLAKMIDRSECVFFLRTSKSISAEQAVKDKTMSPWIYYELETVRSIRVRPADEHRDHIKVAKAENFSRRLQVVYPANLDRFANLSSEDRQLWIDECIGLDEDDFALDALYDLMPSEQEATVIHG